MPRESPTKEREKIIFPTNTETKSSHQDEEDPLNNNKLFTVHAAASHPISQSKQSVVEYLQRYNYLRCMGVIAEEKPPIPRLTPPIKWRYRT